MNGKLIEDTKKHIKKLKKEYRLIVLLCVLVTGAMGISIGASIVKGDYLISFAQCLLMLLNLYNLKRVRDSHYKLLDKLYEMKAFQDK